MHAGFEGPVRRRRRRQTVRPDVWICTLCQDSMQHLPGQAGGDHPSSVVVVVDAASTASTQFQHIPSTNIATTATSATSSATASISSTSADASTIARNQYQKSSGRSIRAHFRDCFRRTFPNTAILPQTALDELIHEYEQRGWVKTGLKSWLTRKPRRGISAIPDFERWTCPVCAVKSFKNTSSQSIRRHQERCTGAGGSNLNSTALPSATDDHSENKVEVEDGDDDEYEDEDEDDDGDDDGDSDVEEHIGQLASASASGRTDQEPTGDNVGGSGESKALPTKKKRKRAPPSSTSTSSSSSPVTHDPNVSARMHEADGAEDDHNNRRKSPAPAVLATVTPDGSAPIVKQGKNTPDKNRTVKDRSSHGLHCSSGSSRRQASSAPRASTSTSGLSSRGTDSIATLMQPLASLTTTPLLAAAAATGVTLPPLLAPQFALKSAYPSALAVAAAFASVAALAPGHSAPAVIAPRQSPAPTSPGSSLPKTSTLQVPSSAPQYPLGPQSHTTSVHPQLQPNLCTDTASQVVYLRYHLLQLARNGNATAQALLQAALGGTMTPAASSAPAQPSQQPYIHPYPPYQPTTPTPAPLLLSAHGPSGWSTHAAAAPMALPSGSFHDHTSQFAATSSTLHHIPPALPLAAAPTRQAPLAVSSPFASVVPGGPDPALLLLPPPNLLFTSNPAGALLP